ncbi:Mannitol-1-phosphate 5-dehydrogenase [Citrobacter portucalensis]|nr:Mannitol-1-phosphate 5-dehydrogenase [Citrobacter portucalensis]
MRFAYQAYGAPTFVGRIRRSRHPAKLCLMRFAYQAYEADTFVGWLRHPITR